ncbi:hypothetical protein C4N20_02025 [Fusobacterium ulcerans]|uniref:Uncharacterized protein n=1 Tax=Fusobacterium ulcerans TaxID=861 RepID=A0AAX2JCE9_9FUSO|nr:hypothetical protein [Fusobacterium ulcerans]AVQ26911.1 hypothetical protein C4N20_02025 [Fusobacterium ulcerans]EFS24960.1 hypothetical protein FUAG_00475 [Fusobacterium ulcerans ATCC 49185]SQJ09276.1 Uncharacterised protein [Fusobacterium ulcerans]
MNKKIEAMKEALVTELNIKDPERYNRELSELANLVLTRKNLVKKIIANDNEESKNTILYEKRYKQLNKDIVLKIKSLNEMFKK